MISFMDRIRVELLRRSLKFSALKTLFYSRPKRILFLSMIAILFYLPVSLYFPLWVLLIGPILWGVPHLISSIRYVNRENKIKSDHADLLKTHFLFWILVFIYRICVDILQIQLPLSETPLFFESLILLIAFILQILWFKRYSFKELTFFCAFCGLAILTYRAPLMTAACLLIGHNFVGLIYWYKSCRNPQDLKVFGIFSIIFCLASFGILTGQFDFMFKLFQAQPGIEFLNWNYSDLVAPFAGDNYDYKFWYRFVCLYAFTQALHYFIWLKAIPETNQPDQHPPSFHWTFNKLSSEFGNGSVMLLVSLILVTTSVWLIYEFQTARLFYLCLASYHGYMELSGLAFTESQRSK